MDALPINGLDLAVVIVLLISAVLAFMRGFVHEVLSVAAWIGGILSVVYGVPELRHFARDFIANDLIADIATSVVIFLSVLVVLSILTKMLSKSIQASALNNLDRSLGFVFGLLRGAVILAAALLILDWIIDTGERPDWVRSAKTLPVIEGTADFLQSLAPESFMAAEDAAKEASDTAKDAMDLKETFDKLTQPPPGSDPDAPQTPDGAYQKNQRNSMDRLFQTNQDDN
ncbi:MAG: CvpA family protein [Rhodospirillaceae bacterium]|jgi:membrane protein required for colicin V production|nr:CvpA family protein [Rhodospirillaceae bacterium]MBT5242124.1 CvpA family protein [Rhodospirillaceae bacterium]MBT5565850.1 CvpA family protein [Rhodospirillaceae bacterium]MBT6088728.1 CvpA family protein [Rhodospirillaceae bacterium]MBT6961059.1 CvpA family protein [Rhodospirillaceae bacterium]